MWLVGSSLLFYSWWNPVYLPLILVSMFISYAIGTGLSSSYKQFEEKNGIKLRISRKNLLMVGVFFNLVLLGYFKYTDFFIMNFNGIFGTDVPLQHIILPLAISFFTFQQIAYLVDSFRGETKEYDLLNYMLFVTFFPQLIAGPIVHHKEMMPQFFSKWNLVKSYRNIALGLFIFSIGLFKKVVIADTFAQWVSAGFDHSTILTFFEAWATSLSYTFQLYFDFSGYADMAIGAALLFNIRLPINFNSPYKATSIQDFWRRWHMTLSRFLRDYVYIPLGGNRKGEYFTYINLLATFLIGGIWHGASWMFIVWGALHGIALVIHRFWQQLGFQVWSWLAWLITFNFINITWVFFRAADIDSALKILGGMVGLNGIILPEKLSSSLGFLANYSDVEFGKWLTIGSSELVVWIALALVVVVSLKNSMHYFKNWKPTKLNLFFTIVLSVTALLSLLGSGESEFLYFNF